MDGKRIAPFPLATPTSLAASAPPAAAARPMRGSSSRPPPPIIRTPPEGDLVAPLALDVCRQQQMGSSINSVPHSQLHPTLMSKDAWVEHYCFTLS